MLLRIASGKLVPFTHLELLHMLKQPWFHVFIIVATFGTAVVYPFERPAGQTVMTVAVFWVITAYLFALVFILSVAFTTTILERLGWRWVFEPPITLVAVIINTFIGSQISFWMAIYVPMTVQERIVNIAINFLAVEFCVLLYIYVLREYVFSPFIPSRSEDSTVTLNPRVFIGDGKTINSAEISIVEAQGHYVRVLTKDVSTMTRARFTSVVNQLPPQSGIQIHRSIWIAMHNIRSVRKQRGAMTIILNDGDELNVARPRQNEVAANLREHGYIF